MTVDHRPIALDAPTAALDHPTQAVAGMAVVIDLTRLRAHDFFVPSEDEPSVSEEVEDGIPTASEYLDDWIFKEEARRDAAQEAWMEAQNERSRLEAENTEETKSTIQTKECALVSSLFTFDKCSNRVDTLTAVKESIVGDCMGPVELKSGEPSVQEAFDRAIDSNLVDAINRYVQHYRDRKHTSSPALRDKVGEILPLLW